MKHDQRFALMIGMLESTPLLYVHERDFYEHDRLTLMRVDSEQPFIWLVTGYMTHFIVGGEPTKGSHTHFHARRLAALETIAIVVGEHRPHIIAHWDGKTLREVTCERAADVITGCQHYPSDEACHACGSEMT